MIGVPISDIIAAFRLESARVLKRTNGDMAKVVYYALSELQTLGILSAEDRKTVAASFGEALDVLVGKRTAVRAVVSARKRYASLIAKGDASAVARVLTELCLSVIADHTTASSSSPSGVLAAVTTTTLKGSAQQSLFWGALGAFAGGSLGGPAGALIGGAIGAALGSCGDSDTTIVTNTGGGSPA